MKKRYFPIAADAPPPLSVTVQRRVRFEEVDAIGYVWHGRYASYFEDARVALGARYGLGYMDFYRRGVIAPLKQLHVEYHRPLRFEDDFTIEARWHYSEAARLNYEFIIRDSTAAAVATGYSVQMMLDGDNDFLVVPPPFYQQFLRRWRAGELQ